MEKSEKKPELLPCGTDWSVREHTVRSMYYSRSSVRCLKVLVLLPQASLNTGRTIQSTIISTLSCISPRRVLLCSVPFTTEY